MLLNGQDIREELQNEEKNDIAYIYDSDHGA